MMLLRMNDHGSNKDCEKGKDLARALRTKSSKTMPL